MRSTEGKNIGVALIENVMAAQDRTLLVTVGVEEGLLYEFAGIRGAWIRGRCSSVGARM